MRGRVKQKGQGTMGVMEATEAREKSGKQSFETNYDYLKHMCNVLAKGELMDANQHNPLFADNHHAYAVIKEELEETKEEIAVIEETMEKFWRNVRNDEKPVRNLVTMREAAINAAVEAIQVAAMCQKACESHFVKLTKKKGAGGND